MCGADVPADFDPSLPFALLDDSRAAGTEPASTLFWAPRRAVVARSGAELGAALDAVDEARRAGLHPCGYVAYEAGYFLVEAPAFTLDKATRDDLPLALFQCFARRQRLDRAAVDRFLDAVGGAEPCAVHDTRLSLTRTEYVANVEEILALIAAGHTYQVNYTFRTRFAFAGSAPALYRELRRHQAVEFGALLAFPEARVLSLSPELFVRKQGETVVCRPMKGTARRGVSPAEDGAIVAALRSDPKTLAENLMIVDLIRSDVGRIAAPGSVVARDLFEVQTFETLHQMVSTVEGRVPADLPSATALRALLPCGSVTGAPKARTMEIIEKLEPQPRGVYCGAIGYVAPDGDFAFNVPIRTVVSTSDGEAELGVGSGIVAESDPVAELEECLLKARFVGRVNQAFQILETMRAEAGEPLPARFDLHLARMAVSASAFGFAFEPGRLTAAVRDARASGPDGTVRVRALLHHDGRVEVTASAIPEPGAGARRLAWSARPIDSRSVFQRHKTTVRDHYDRAFTEASGGGAYDILFLNERGEVAEASRHNLFIERGGLLLTPPVSSGALPGVARAALLDDRSRRAVEAVLRVGDVLAADRVLLCNALRGLVEVTPLPLPDAVRARSAPRE